MVKDRRLRFFVSWLSVVLWMALIFSLSSQPAEQSDGLSKGISEIVVETYEKVSKDSDTSIEAFNSVFRKYAHLLAYLVLGILVANSFYQSGQRGLKMIAFTMLLCLVYAVSDEIHQAFVPGRGPQLRDVLIDGLGAMVGTLIYKGIIR